MKRRIFIQSGTFMAAGMLLRNSGIADLFSNKKSNWPIGLQLYSLGDLMITDTKGTLQKLAEIGYKEVESAGSKKGNFYGYTPKEFAGMVKDAGLHWRSAHVGGAPLSVDQIMKMAKTAEDSAR